MYSLFKISCFLTDKFVENAFIFYKENPDILYIITKKRESEAYFLMKRSSQFKKHLMIDDESFLKETR